MDCQVVTTWEWERKMYIAMQKEFERCTKPRLASKERRTRTYYSKNRQYLISRPVSYNMLVNLLLQGYMILRVHIPIFRIIICKRYRARFETSSQNLLGL